MKNITTIIEILNNRKYRSAWDKGVQLYVNDMIDEIRAGIEGGWTDDDDLLSFEMLKRILLNGASSWSDYSYGGCALCYDADIAERLCTPSELKKTRNGEKNPNSRENWLDVQTRALHQAASRIYSAARIARMRAQKDSNRANV